MVTHIHKIRGKLAHGRITPPLLLIVQSPPKRSTPSPVEELGDTAIGRSTLTPPGSDTCLSTPIAHSGDVLAYDRRVRGIIETEGRVVIGIRVVTLLGPGAWEPWVVKEGSDRKRRLYVRCPCRCRGTRYIGDSSGSGWRDRCVSWRSSGCDCGCSCT
jgi:hypothetical protein